MATKNSKIISITNNRAEYNAETEKASNVIGNRIAEARKRAGLSQPEFRERLVQYGLTMGRAAESQWETGRTIPNAYQLIAVCAALDIEDMRFFTQNYTPVLNDEGEKKLADYKADLVASGRYRPVPKQASVIRYREMPISNLMVSAGTGAFLDEGNFDMISFPENTIPDGADFGVRVSGDSMEPVYHDGQIVWVKQSDNIAEGEVGIFTVDGEGFIKCYAEQLPDEDMQEEYMDTYGVLHLQPVLVSYNQSYPPRVILPTSDFRMVGKVL